jgi:hypothetical protein
MKIRPAANVIAFAIARVQSKGEPPRLFDLCSNLAVSPRAVI